MKKAILILSICLTIGFTLKAQAPQGFNYQAVARNNSGVAVINQSIGLKINLRQGTATGTITYSETHTVTSSNIGLLNLVVGEGTVLSGTFNTIDWSAGPYFIEISMDIAGGTNYVLMGTQQLMSVPYALYAANGGTTGAQGTTGATGSTGAQGAIGVTGAVGSTGILGATGLIGATGDIGIAGATGNTGSTGATGIAGPIGDRYATTSPTSLDISVPTTPLTFTVETGLAYSIGQEVIIAFSSTQQMVGTITNFNSGTGLMNVTVTTSTGSGSGLQPWSINLNGAPGPAGPVGATGNNGSNGSTGTTGSTGATGNNGTNGLTGATGTNGIDGSTGATGTNGINGATGSTGTTGATGATGNNGTNGNTGSTGSTGATGAVATFAVEFNITNIGGGFLFDNASDYVSGANLKPVITLYRGFTYKFNISTGGSHPFLISLINGGAAFTVGVTNNGTGQGTITFKVPQNAPTTLFYYCTAHASMGNTINIQ
ncbi:MAG: collagen-like protein [Bacteroidota bacterium]